MLRICLLLNCLLLTVSRAIGTIQQMALRLAPINISSIAVFRNPSNIIISEQATSPQLIKKIHRILWNSKVHHRIHKNILPLAILSQNNRVHTPQSNALSIHFNIILQSMPRSYKWSLSYRFLHRNPLRASPLSHTCYMPHQSHYYCSI